MRSWLGTAAVALAALGLAGCQVEQEQEGELPEVEVEGGQLPEYDVEAAEVEVRPDTEEVIVPDIEVNPPAEDTVRRP